MSLVTPAPDFNVERWWFESADPPDLRVDRPPSFWSSELFFFPILLLLILLDLLFTDPPILLTLRARGMFTSPMDLPLAWHQFRKPRHPQGPLFLICSIRGTNFLIQILQQLDFLQNITRCP